VSRLLRVTVNTALTVPVSPSVTVTSLTLTIAAALRSAKSTPALAPFAAALTV